MLAWRIYGQQFKNHVRSPSFIAGLIIVMAALTVGICWIWVVFK